MHYIGKYWVTCVTFFNAAWSVLAMITAEGKGVLVLTAPSIWWRLSGLISHLVL